ncbi:hypothetical protein F5878DRAFT_664675 [Lentinula raphanica]|uniref:Uncharacterized protein n=1 Tax=Lentinula raphanica TaxID=153919 RepID=A0AA38P1R2_9AGAR|nr:hypothetical protein F5878DRAFT_664675 [Lentinula raphanica]
MDQTKREIVLTGNVRSDIVLLSSALRGHQMGLSFSRDKKNPKLAVLTCVSAILTIDNVQSPRTSNVHAVSARIDVDNLECLVCAENTDQLEDSVVSPMEAPEAGRLEEVREVANSDRGAKLLDSWAQDIDGDLVKREYTLQEHIRDVFQILTYIGSHSWQNTNFTFALLIHRRASRKVGWRIREFLTRWGKSPFLIIQDAIRNTTVKASSEFTINFIPTDLEVLNQCKFPFFEDDLERTQSTQRSRNVHVDSENIKAWIGGFINIFDLLQSSFPPPKKRPGPIPTDEQVIVGVFLIRCLQRLKSVVKFILEIPGVVDALDRCENEEAERRSNRYQAQDASVLKNFQFPKNKAFVPRDPQRVPLENESDENQEKEHDDDDNDDASFFVPEPELSVQETNHFLQSLGTITAWLVSVTSLSKHACHLFGKEMKVDIFSCPKVPKTEYGIGLKYKLNNIFPDLGLLTDQKQFTKIVEYCCSAKIHAESALMAWAHGNCSESQKLLGTDIAIAVSKKCCYMCWKLQEKLNGRGEIRFDLPGTHNIIFPWIPPREVPEQILVELRDDLIAIAEKISRSHSRQSSGVSADDDDDDDDVQHANWDVYRDVLKEYRKSSVIQ